MIIHYQGQEWEFDADEIGVDEWRELKRKYKMTPGQFETGMQEADPDASTFAWWVMLRRSGNHQMPLGDHLKPDILALNAAFAVAQAAELAAAADDPADGDGDADPTPPPGSPPPSASPRARQSRSRTREAATGS